MFRHLKQPLVQFVLFGAVLFAVHAIWSCYVASEEQTIHVRTERLQQLSTVAADELGRSPTGEDMRRLLADYVREEVLYREALRLGLDRNDTIIRRRLAQKMGFLLNATEPQNPLGYAELRAAYEANPDLYAEPARISFDHIPFTASDETAPRTEDIAAALVALIDPETDTDWTELGDPFLLSRTHIDIAQSELARLFGEPFAERVFQAERTGWMGPVQSRLATHLIRITQRTPRTVPPFEAVIEQVRAYETARRESAARDTAMQALIDRYTVILDGENP